MCEPTTLLAISSAVSVASTLAAHVGQGQVAKQQDRAVRTDYNMGVAQLERQRLEQNVQSRTEMGDRARQAMIERSRLRAASAEGGVGGNSIDRIFGTHATATSQDMAMMSENARNVNRQSAMGGMSMQASATGRLNQIERPSVLNTGLQIAGIGVGAAQQYKKIK